MNYFTLKVLPLTVVSIALAACGGGGSSTPEASMAAPTPSNVSDPIPTSGNSRSNLAALAGGDLARQIADETAAFTQALNDSLQGSPSSLMPGEEDDDDFAVAPPSIGTDIPITYFGPSPTSVNRNLVGPLQLLTAGQLDLEAEPTTTLTLPLYQGRLQTRGPNNGQSIWYVVTDTSDKENAAALGLNFSAKLRFTNLPEGMSRKFMSQSVRSGYYDESGMLVFRGGYVDFAPERIVNAASTDTSGTHNLLTELQFQPGATGSDVGDRDGFYSPLVEIENAGGHVYNAPMVAFGVTAETLSAYCEGVDDGAKSILHDKVVSICPGANGEPGTVTLELTNGFSFGRPVLYLSTDASAEIAASLEGAIYTPAMANIPVGRDDSLFSSIERIFGFTNGPVNIADEVNPQRQGFNSAITGEGFPLNVLGGIPTIATDYSPLWDLNLGEWTQDAIDRGYRSRMTEEFAILGMVERGFITGPGGSEYSSTGIIINCPIVHRLL